MQDSHLIYDSSENSISFRPIDKKIIAKYLFYISNNKQNYSQLESLCILTNNNMLDQLKINHFQIKPKHFPYESTINTSKNDAYLKYSLFKLDTGEYYINLVAVTEEGEFLAYNSVKIEIKPPGFFLVFLVFYIVFACLLTLIVFICFKYRKTKRRLELERIDLSRTDKYKTNKELEEMKIKGSIENVKYVNLSENSDGI
jgi:hypothetical protein